MTLPYVNPLHRAAQRQCCWVSDAAGDNSVASTAEPLGMVGARVTVLAGDAFAFNRSFKSQPTTKSSSNKKGATGAHASISLASDDDLHARSGGTATSCS